MPAATARGIGAGRVARGHMVLLGVLCVIGLVIPVFVLVPVPKAVHQAWYDVIAVMALGAGFVGLWFNRPARRRGWVLVLLGYAGWVVGDVVWTVEQHVIPGTYPAPSDAVYLSSYVLLGAGALVFARLRRGGRDLPALLDSAIVTTGVGVLFVVFFIAPLAADASSSPAARFVSSAYPLGDLFLLGVLVRLSAVPSARTAAYRLLAASMLVTLGSDIWYTTAVTVTGEIDQTGWIEAGWLLGYVFAGAAACVPSMTAVTEPAPDRAERIPSRRRLALLAAGSMLPGVVLLVNGAGGGRVLWPVIGVGTIVLSLLVLLRMVGLLHVVQVQAVRLAALAHSDALTGAPNRRTWDLELSRACQTTLELGTTLAVSIIDLDHFKAYNDTRGHQAGDRLLREAVAAWGEALPEDALLARYGGEEFAVLFPGVNAQTAATALERLRAVTPDGQTFSAGVALWEPGTDPSDAIAAADEALYVAKRSGRNRVVVHGPASTTAPGPRRTLPAFEVVVQPIADLTTFAVYGHEVLTRFTGADASTGVQDVFRAAHEAGDGDLLELAAIHSGLAKPDRPAGQDLFVNVSARALTSERFLAGLPVHLDGVVVELCENTDDIELWLVAEAISRLRARGARIALDDVGAGAQDFARLARLRPDIVKIDRSLVQGCSQDPGLAALLRALVSYTDEMGLALCAEGVEEAADLRMLIDLGVRHAQGYLLGRPGVSWRAGLTTEEMVGAVS